ncbi:MAG: hypothetical protein RIT81_31175 [Deltaproteobacteria bacterium]
MYLRCAALLVLIASCHPPPGAVRCRRYVKPYVTGYENHRGKGICVDWEGPGAAELKRQRRAAEHAKMKAAPKACRGGDLSGCRRLVVANVEAGRYTKAREWADLAEEKAPPCTKRLPDACAEFAYIYAATDSPKTDPLRRRLCASGRPTFCDSIRRPTARRPPRTSPPTTTSGCSIARSERCAKEYQLALVSPKHETIESPRVRSVVETMRATCESKREQCGPAAFAYATGLGVEPSRTVVESMAGRERKMPRDRFLRTFVPTPWALQSASRDHVKKCEKLHCTWLAEAVIDGQVKLSADEVQRLFKAERARAEGYCAKELPGGCFLLARIARYTDSPDAATAERRAQEVFEAFCTDPSQAKYCARVQRYRTLKFGSPTDRAKAIAELRTDCEGGVAQSCRSLVPFVEDEATRRVATEGLAKACRDNFVYCPNYYRVALADR